MRGLCEQMKMAWTITEPAVVRRCFTARTIMVVAGLILAGVWRDRPSTRHSMRSRLRG